MKQKVTAIVEMTSDGMYSCSIIDGLGNFGIVGYGSTPDESREDMLVCYEEMKEINAQSGVETPELDISYKYDMQTFFKKFSYFNITKIGEKAGINPSLIRRYAAGVTNAGEAQYKKLSKAINDIKDELSSVVF